jgi:glycosyltransferase involved in cell wall biosynthesis
MRRVCVVTNYNYDSYLPLCLDSLINQSVRFEEIYVIDDGSTDRSSSVISDYAKSFPEVIPLLKVNAGQLSCFNFVTDYITENDLVWFIDSDDYYPSDYVERFLGETKESESDFFFCKTIKFSSNDLPPETSYQGKHNLVNIGVSTEMTRLTRCWIGGPTSSIVVSGRLFKDIFPYPFEDQWVTCADEILVFAASLGGYSKTYIPSLGFGYRIHESNKEYGRDYDCEERKNRIRNRDVLFSWYIKKFELNPQVTFANVLDEYYSISSSHYRKIINVSIHRIFKKYLIRKFRNALNMNKNKG